MLDISKVKYDPWILYENVALKLSRTDHHMSIVLIVDELPTKRYWFLEISTVRFLSKSARNQAWGGLNGFNNLSGNKAPEKNYKTNLIQLWK